MKRSLLSVLMVTLLLLGLGACAPKPAAQLGPTLRAPTADVAVRADRVTKLADVPTANVATAAEGEITSADALKLILLQWLVAR